MGISIKKEIIDLLKKVETEERNPYVVTNNPISQLGPDSNQSEYEEAFKIYKRDHLLTNDYDTFLEETESNATIRQYLDFPNFSYIVRKIETIYENQENKKLLVEGLVLSNLKRMEKDGLILVSTQNIREYVIGYNSDFTVRIFGEGWNTQTECVVLTTKGKNQLDYLLYQIEEQKFAVAALILSLVSLVFSIFTPFK